MSLIIKTSWKAGFSTLAGGDTIKATSLALLESCMTDAVLAAVTGPDAAIDLEAIQDIVSLFDLDVDLNAGASGTGEDQKTL